MCLLLLNTNQIPCKLQIVKDSNWFYHVKYGCALWHFPWFAVSQDSAFSQPSWFSQWSITQVEEHNISFGSVIKTPGTHRKSLFRVNSEIKNVLAERKSSAITLNFLFAGLTYLLFFPDVAKLKKNLQISRCNMGLNISLVLCWNRK